MKKLRVVISNPVWKPVDEKDKQSSPQQQDPKIVKMKANVVPKALAWRSMDAVPQDGSVVLLRMEEKAATTAQWQSGKRNGRKHAGWKCNITGKWLEGPLAWMPFPGEHTLPAGTSRKGI